jgi:hypothetical protein
MGSNQSNLVNEQVSRILENDATSTPTNSFQTSNLDANNSSEEKNKYVDPNTANSPMNGGSETSNANMSLNMPSNMPLSETSLLGGSDTSSVNMPLGNMPLSDTSLDGGSETSAVSSDFQTKSNLSPTSSEGGQMRVVKIDPNTFLTESSETANQMKGGYSYAAEVSENASLRGGDEHYGNAWKGGVRVINLDSAFESSDDEKNKDNNSNFNPENFFNQMQKGGILGERKMKSKKDFKKSKLDESLSVEREDDDEDFDLDEATSKLNLEVDEDDDTENLKQKVKALRAMVSRSKPKGKKSKKAKRSSARSSENSTEEYVSAGGNNSRNTSGNNSVSEYLNSTSSISTSDVRLISMNRK